jgi:hypothetical protein
MPLAIPTNIEVLDMLPILVTVFIPVRARAIITSLTHSSAVRIATMAEQVVPRIAIEVAHKTFVVVRGVAEVLLERSLGAIRSVAAVTVPGRGELM